MKNSKIELFDTTLRDGTQGEGVNLSVEDKIRLAKAKLKVALLELELLLAQEEEKQRLNVSSGSSNKPTSRINTSSAPLALGPYSQGIVTAAGTRLAFICLLYTSPSPRD